MTSKTTNIKVRQGIYTILFKILKFAQMFFKFFRRKGTIDPIELLEILNWHFVQCIYIRETNVGCEVQVYTTCLFNDSKIIQKHYTRLPDLDTWLDPTGKCFVREYQRKKPRPPKSVKVYKEKNREIWQKKGV